MMREGYRSHVRFLPTLRSAGYLQVPNDMDRLERDLWPKFHSYATSLVQFVLSKLLDGLKKLHCNSISIFQSQGLPSNADRAFSILIASVMRVDEFQVFDYSAFRNMSYVAAIDCHCASAIFLSASLLQWIDNTSWAKHLLSDVAIMMSFSLHDSNLWSEICRRHLSLCFSCCSRDPVSEVVVITRQSCHDQVQLIIHTSSATPSRAHECNSRCHSMRSSHQAHQLSWRSSKLLRDKPRKTCKKKERNAAPPPSHILLHLFLPQSPTFRQKPGTTTNDWYLATPSPQSRDVHVNVGHLQPRVTASMAVWSTAIFMGLVAMTDVC